MSAAFPRPDRRPRVHPLLIRLANGDDRLARAVIDASGTWTTANVLGASGIPHTAKQVQPVSWSTPYPTFWARRLRAHVDAGTIDVVTDFAVERLETTTDQRVRVSSAATTLTARSYRNETCCR